MTSSHHGPYVKGDTSATMGGPKGCQLAKARKTQKATLSSDWRLQPDSMKLESLVSADQHAAVNAFPGLVVTARHTRKIDCTISRWANIYLERRQAPTVWLVIWVKS